MQYQQQFIRFLKSNHAYLSYRRNRIQDGMASCNKRNRNPIILWLRFSSPQYISAAFCWDKTPQGIRYWNFLSQQWDIQRQELSNYVKKEISPKIHILCETNTE